MLKHTPTGLSARKKYIERTLQILETLGVGDLFNATADFSTLTDQHGVLFDDAVHKAKIQLDEEGIICTIIFLIISLHQSMHKSSFHLITNAVFALLSKACDWKNVPQNALQQDGAMI